MNFFNMRDIKKLQVIHFYPNRSTMEFFNIGVIVHSADMLAFKLMDESHLSMLNCSTFIDKKVLGGLLQYLKNALHDVDSPGVLNSRTKSMYFDNFSFSAASDFASEHSCEIEARIMFSHYIESKFKRYDMVTKKEKMRESAKTIIGRDFDSAFMFDESDEYYDLIIKSKIKPVSYPTIVGSLANDADIMHAVRAQLHRPVNNSYYGYINGSDEIERNEEKFANAMGLLERKIGMGLIDFSSEEAIGASLERWASSI